MQRDCPCNQSVTLVKKQMLNDKKQSYTEENIWIWFTVSLCPSQNPRQKFILPEISCNLSKVIVWLHSQKHYESITQLVNEVVDYIPSEATR